MRIGPLPALGRPRSARRGAGFTLLEVILVLVIGAIAYVAVLTLPSRGASAADLKAAARSLASGLRHAQTMAMATRRDSALTIDVESREYTVAGDPTVRQLPTALEIKLYTAQSEVTSERHGAIRFYPDGSSTGGRITIASGPRKYLVDVDWLTGRVSINE